METILQYEIKATLSINGEELSSVMKTKNEIIKYADTLIEIAKMLPDRVIAKQNDLNPSIINVKIINDSLKKVL